MLDSRVLVLAAMVTGLSGASVRADTILSWGLFSGLSSSPGSISAPASSGTGFLLGQATTSGAIATAPVSTTSINLANSDPTVQTAISTPTNYGIGTPSFSTVSTSTPPTFDAFVNLGAGPYSNAAGLTTGNALPWYDSRQVIGLFGGQPTAQQQATFDSTVLQRVERTFQLSGVPVTLTDNPNASAAHTLSVVSNTVNPSLTNAIGMTYLGGNGFHFIDNSAPAAQSVNQLEWIVAHNVAHELMLAFGVPETHDQTGKFIDSTAGQLAMFLNPNATFSTGAVQDLLSQNFLSTNSLSNSAGPQTIGSANVPEPATLALWGLGAMVLVVARRARSARSA